MSPDPAAAAPACPLCRGRQTAVLMVVGGRCYHRCADCELRFLDPAQRPDAATERACYATHQNHVDDPGYRRFLGRLVGALLPRLQPCAEGLDYGCGPAPALAAMLGESGYHMSCHDPFFAPQPALLQRDYDFVTCTEVAEHFHDPAAEFARLSRLVRPGGWLAVMTCFQTDDARFANWHYRRDPTHVVFYRALTFRWLALDLGWELVIPVKDVALLQRPQRRAAAG